jgi:hypothetical protein
MGTVPRKRCLRGRGQGRRGLRHGDNAVPMLTVQSAIHPISIAPLGLKLHSLHTISESSSANITDSTNYYFP